MTIAHSKKPLVASAFVSMVFFGTYQAEVARGDVLTVKVSVDKRKNLTEEVVDGIAEETIRQKCVLKWISAIPVDVVPL